MYAKSIAQLCLRCKYTAHFMYYIWESAFNIIGTAKVNDVCKDSYMYVVYNRCKYGKNDVYLQIIYFNM